MACHSRSGQVTLENVEVVITIGGERRSTLGYYISGRRTGPISNCSANFPWVPMIALKQRAEMTCSHS
jgi:hypothetical protein